ncbi:Mono-ADP Ribosylhydrolase 2, partial [Crotalus adamanteus]
MPPTRHLKVTKALKKRAVSSPQTRARASAVAARAVFVFFVFKSRAPSFCPPERALPPRFDASAPLKKASPSQPPLARERRGRGASLNGVSPGQRAAGKEAGIAGVSVGLEQGVTQLTRAERRGECEGGRGANSCRRRRRQRHPRHPIGAVAQPGQLASSSPVSLGNLQLKAAASHSTMYPGNKRKKLWREEKERLLKMTLEERRKEYSRDYVPLKDIPTWKEEMKNKAQNDEENTNEAFLMQKSLSEKVSLYRGDITVLEIDAIVNA